LRVHERRYVERVCRGELSAREVRRLGFPWSEALVERSRRSVGATMAAARAALSDGAAANLAGGTHHAFADRGEGFCVFNDAAVAARALQQEELAPAAGGRAPGRVAIVDCDVHQGDGTARIFRDDVSVFTLSLHGRRNYPFRKETSDLDVAFDDDTEDPRYLEALDGALDRTFLTRPELVIYLAGADPFRGDRLGRLALTKDGLAERDRRVFERCAAGSVPVAVAMAGGYATDVEDIVEIHERTVRLAVELAADAGARLKAPT
ncbi:MAG: histone deacetylase, partial [Acidobacteriota bacterium]